MFIQTEATPNPSTLKFIPGVTILESGTIDYSKPSDAEGKSPLAERLFTIEGVEGVFLGNDFISIRKSESGGEWQHLKPAILGAIMEHFTSGRPVMSDVDHTSGHNAVEDEFFDEADTEIVTLIKELLDTRVRPAVARDGGDIVFHGFKNGVVFLHMRGACAGCPSSTATLKHGIQNLLRHFIPEVEEVEAVGV